MNKYLFLPIHLIEFWYPESIVFFIRTWKNLTLFLEEDLAVSLMWRLLFVPLFHDSSFVGRVLSFLFRLFRVLIGIFAFVLASLALMLIALYWFSLPFLAAMDLPVLVSKILAFAGVGLFIIHITTHPHKKVWETSNPWSASSLKKGQITFANLLKNFEVVDLLANLELQAEHLPRFTISDIDNLALRAFQLAKNSGSEYIGPRHFFVATIEQIPEIDNLLLKFDLRLPDFINALNYLELKKQIWRKVYVWDEDFVIHHLKGVNRGWLGVPTPNLDKYSEDLTKSVLKLKAAPFVRSNNVISEIINILSQATGRNVILVGAAGSGKTSLTVHLAKTIVAGDAPEALATKRLVLLDLTKLISGIENEGELAQRIKTIFEEVQFAQNIIIVIDEIHELGMGDAGASLNLYSLMQPYLESDSCQFLSTTEPENYSKIIEKNSSFARIFRKIEMPSATELETLQVLQYRAINVQRYEKIRVTFMALKTIIELSKKLIKDKVLPDSAISVLKEAQTQSVNEWVTKAVVQKVMSSRVNVPLMDVGTVQKEKLLSLESQIHENMVDQSEAVKVIADSLRRSATGVREENRPIGSFLFVGPTGVGKTELAKTLAEVYFNQAAHLRGESKRQPGSHLGGEVSGAFLSFDMSEYQNPESISRLIGANEQGGLLTEAVRNRPYALLLFDEFEKANENILTLFLQVLDDGRLTDGAGRTIDFSNTIIIFTSNVGSLLIAQGLQRSESMDLIDKQVNDELLKVYRPELINRFDDVVIFKPLSKEDLEKIVQIKLTGLQKQMKEKGYLIEFSPELIIELAKKGFDPVMGARPLRRLMQDTLEANLSKLILENKLLKGQPLKAGVELLG